MFKLVAPLSAAIILSIPVLALSGSHAGTYKDDRITVTLQESGGAYTGSIVLGQQTFPLNAKETDGELKGAFQSGEDSFQFLATLQGDVLSFATGGTTYNLQRQGRNPLAQPQREKTSISAPPPIPANAVRLKPYSINDSMIGGEAFSMLIPDGWKLEGGVGWRLHPAMPAYLAMKVNSPNGIDELESMPQLPFVWTEGGIAFFPVGSNYLGNEVLPPIVDPLQFVQQIILPRFRQNLKVRIVGQELLPKLADEIAAANQEPGAEKTATAIKVRLEYQHNQKNIEEDLYCVVLYTRVPTIRTTFWYTERLYSFKAEKGKLDQQTKLMQAMVASIKPNLQWFNRYAQLVQVLVQNQLQNIRRTGELSRYIAQTNAEISDMNRQAYENRQASQDRISANFSRYIRGVEQYTDPHTNRPVELPSGYQNVWANPSGEYILSDTPSFNPNVGSNSNWQPIQPKQ